MILFLLFHIDIEGKCGMIIGGPNGMLASSKIIGGGGVSSYAYAESSMP